MIIFLQLVLIGAVSAIILGGVMKILRKLTGNKADILLYNMDYMPVLKRWSDKWITGVIFHFATCICSAVVLYYLLILFGLELTVWPYVLVFTAGGGILYFLSVLTEKPPAYNDFAAWFSWTFGHCIFGISVGYLVSIWI